MSNKILLVGVFALLLLSFSMNVSAITASLGNSRMVLRLEVGEVIEKSLLVRNVNDFPLTIQLTVTGDLEGNVELEDESFILDVGAEKKTYFTIKADEAGTSETKINVAYIPEEGNSVGLSSTIIVIASGEDLGFNNDGDDADSENDQPSDDDQSSDDDESGIGFLTDRAIDVDDNGDSRISPAILLSFTTIILVIATILLLFYYSKNNPKKKAGRSGG